VTTPPLGRGALPPLLAGLQEPVILELTLFSRDSDGQLLAPRTKKNHGVMIRVKGSERIALIPSDVYRAWHKGARKLLLAQIRANLDLQRLLPLAFPMRLHAVFYRDRLQGDLMGFIDGLADFLNDDLRSDYEQQKQGKDGAVRVIENDRWIIGFTRETRLEKDAARPRIELRLEEER